MTLEYYLFVIWFYLPPVIRLAIWIIPGVLLVHLFWRFQSSGRNRQIVAGTFICAYLAFPSVFYFAFYDYFQQREKWLAVKCRETIANPIFSSTSTLIQADGYVDETNYDKLINDRFHRAAAKIESKNPFSSSTTIINTGMYSAHPIFRLIGNGTFAENARYVLLEKKFSYVEIEMTPQGSNGDYLNAGLLKSKQWSGNRYRLYYLAPGDDPRCSSEAGLSLFAGALPPTASATVGSAGVGSAPVGSIHQDALSNSVGVGVGSGMLQKQNSVDKVNPVSKSQPLPKIKNDYCVAMELATKSISNYRLVADEVVETFKWEARLRTVVIPGVKSFQLGAGFPIPAWLDIRLDRIRIRIDRSDSDLIRYTGFDYPDDGASRHTCHNYAAATGILGTMFVADQNRPFYRAKDWYDGSEVQRFYATATNRDTALSRQSRPAPTSSEIVGRFVFEEDDFQAPAEYEKNKFQIVAGDSEVHAIGVYEGKGNSVTVTVARKGRPVVLVLGSYERVIWNIKTEPGVILSKVIASARYQPILNGVQKDIPTYLYWVEGATHPQQLAIGQPVNRSDAIKMAERIRVVTGKTPNSIQGAYRGNSFLVD